MKRNICTLLLLALCLTGALAEDMAVEATPEAEEVEAGAVDNVEAAPVDEAVDEVAFSLGGDDDAPEPEYAPSAPSASQADAFEEWEPGDYILDCPDVYDAGVRSQVTPSSRLYPGTLVWPLEGREPLKHVTSRAGWRDAARIHRRQGGTWASWLHHGIDVGGVGKDQRVVAAADGLAYAGSRKGLGNYVVIDHGDGWYTRYQHLSAYAGDVTAESRAVPVRAGDPVGYVGNTGGDYPVHLHFELAWSPDGGGSDDDDYQRETHNKRIRVYSFSQQSYVKLRWAEKWEICAADKQTYVMAPATPDAEEAP